MKTKVTKKQVMSYNSNVLEVGYCDLQFLYCSLVNAACYVTILTR